MSNPQNQNPSKPPKSSVNPVAAIVIIVVCVGGFIIFLMETAVKTPLVREFEDAASQARQSACETRKSVDESQGIKNTEDCTKK